MSPEQLQSLLEALGKQHADGGDDRGIYLIAIGLVILMAAILLFVLKKVADMVSKNSERFDTMHERQGTMIMQITSATTQSIDKVTEGLEDVAESGGKIAEAVRRQTEELKGLGTRVDGLGSRVEKVEGVVGEHATLARSLATLHDAMGGRPRPGKRATEQIQVGGEGDGDDG